MHRAAEKGLHPPQIPWLASAPIRASVHPHSMPRLLSTGFSTLLNGYTTLYASWCPPTAARPTSVDVLFVEQRHGNYTLSPLSANSIEAQHAQ